MLTHRRIWDAIDSLAARHNLSTSGLAKRAGLDPTTFNKSKRVSADGKPRWPSTESIAKILEATGSGISDFVDLLGDAAAPRALKIELQLLGTIDGKPAPPSQVVGIDSASPTVSLPKIEAGKTVAVRVIGDGMVPVYRAGDILVVAPDVEIRDGDRVVIKTRRGEILASELVRKSTEQTMLHSLDPSVPDRTLENEDISWIGRVLLVSQ